MKSRSITTHTTDRTANISTLRKAALRTTRSLSNARCRYLRSPPCTSSNSCCIRWASCMLTICRLRALRFTLSLCCCLALFSASLISDSTSATVSAILMVWPTESVTCPSSSWRTLTVSAYCLRKASASRAKKPRFVFTTSYTVCLFSLVSAVFGRITSESCPLYRFFTLL